MSNEVPDYYRTLSERLSYVLYVIGFSQEDRDRKVRHATGWEVLKNIRHSGLIANRYMLGSRGEGSTGPGLCSDRDVLVASDRLNIITDIFDFQRGKINFLMLHDEWTHPGYVKLQSMTMLPDNTLVPTFHYESQIFKLDSWGRTVLSNNHITYVSFDGPAIRDTKVLKELSVDNVLAIRGIQWPTEAHEWFQRRRLHRWPKMHHIRNANKDGCFVVAVGHPQSHEQELEWRLSFSFTERKLIRSFEDIVMKVYILLKMIRKTYIEPLLGKAFTSYHCKVCMLWMREKLPQDLWRTENLFYCLTLCIKQLYEWASMGYCPDYFIVTNNIYDRKIFGETRCILIKVLGVLVSEDCRYLLGLECCNLGELLLSDCSNVGISHRLLDIIVPLFSEVFTDNELIVSSANEYRTCMLRDIPQESNILISCILIMMHAFQRAPHTLRIYLHYILLILMSQLGFFVASVCKENAHSLSREEIDHLMDLASMCLSLGINSDATSVRLKLCGLGTMLGYYDMVDVCLQHINDQYFRCIFSGSLEQLYATTCNIRQCAETILTERCSIEKLLQNQLSSSVVYLPSETSITPIALRMEMFRTISSPTEVRDDEIRFWYEWAVIDSLVCIYFFQYLNFSRPGKERHRHAAIENMKHVIMTEPYIHHRDTGLNLLGYSFMQEAQFRNAFICFYKSLIIRKHYNAAKFYLGILFRKVHVHRRRGERY